VKISGFGDFQIRMEASEPVPAQCEAVLRWLAAPSCPSLLFPEPGTSP